VVDILFRVIQRLNLVPPFHSRLIRGLEFGIFPLSFLPFSDLDFLSDLTSSFVIPLPHLTLNVPLPHVQRKKGVRSNLYS